MASQVGNLQGCLSSKPCEGKGVGREVEMVELTAQLHWVGIQHPPACGQARAVVPY